MRIATIKIILFTILFVLIDILSRPVFMSLMANAKPSAIKNMYDIATRCNNDIIILGSSRAMHHYDSRIIEDSLKMTCMNCGAMSNGIVLMYGRYKLLTKRYNPKIIIYDVHPPFDLMSGDNSKYIPTLRPFSDDNHISALFNKIDKRENWKVNCNLYRFNSLLPELIADNIKEDKNLFNGYSPLYNAKPFTPPHSINATLKVQNINYDSLKISLFHEMIIDCKNRNINLIFAISPTYHHDITQQAVPIFNLCRQYNIPIMCFENNKFPIETKYFYDSSHLNDCGAKMYTKLFVSEFMKLRN